MSEAIETGFGAHCTQTSSANIMNIDISEQLPRVVWATVFSKVSVHVDSEMCGIVNKHCPRETAIINVYERRRRVEYSPFFQKKRKKNGTPKHCVNKMPEDIFVFEDKCRVYQTTAAPNWFSLLLRLKLDIHLKHNVVAMS